MSDVLIVHKGRANVVQVSAIGMDFSTETVTSEVRAEPDQSSSLIVTWDVEFATDGTDGELILTIDTATANGITADFGYMDIKRAVGSEELSLFSKPIEVRFQGSVTA